MKTSINNLKFYLVMVAFVMSGYTIVAQSSLKDLPHEDPPPLAVEQLDKDIDELKIYASNGDLNISFEYAEMGKVKVQLFDVAGREIVNESVDKNSNKFEFKHDVSNLPKSVYIVRILQDKKKITRKLYI